MATAQDHENGPIAPTTQSPAEVTSLGEDAVQSDLSSLLCEMRALRLKVANLERNNSIAPLRDDSEDELPDPDIESSTDDEVSYDPVYEKWKLRRQVARQIIRKSDNMRRQRHKPGEVNAQLGERNATSSHEEIVTTSKVDADGSMSETFALSPTLKKVRWAEFKAKHSNAAIDVLIGSPEVVWHSDATQKSTFPRKQTAPNARTPIEIEGEYAGEQPLPERIRIKSKLLLRILADIQNARWLYIGADSIVFLRPYKLLVCYRQEIRGWYQKLLEKHEHAINEGLKLQVHAVSGPISEAILGSSTKSQATCEQEPPQIVSKGGVDELIDLPAVESALALQHMYPLIDFLENYVSARQKYLESERCEKVTFHDLWLLFKPGDEIVDSSGSQVYRITGTSTRRHVAKPPWSFGAHTDYTSPPPPPPPQVHVSTHAPILSPEPTFDSPPPPPPPNRAYWEGDDKPFHIRCAYLDTDGHNVGPVGVNKFVNAFEGEKYVRDLDVYPLRLRAALLSVPGSIGTHDIPTIPRTLRRQIIERGKYFMKMSSIRHVHYAGPLYRSREMLDGQVVIDNLQAFTMGVDTERPSFTRLLDSTPLPPPDIQLTLCDAQCCAHDVVWEDSSMDVRRNIQYQQSLLPMSREEIPSLVAMLRPIAALTKPTGQFDIDEDEYVIMSDRAFGFVLRSRKWEQLDLAYISEIEYQLRSPSDMVKSGTGRSNQKESTKTAFDDLVLPPGHRKLILSLVAQHFRDEGQQEMDIFRGKGKGLILLLHGAPGVGKTSTAEGVAQAFKRPLLQITCGDLGSTAKEVEEALERNFALASRWDCVLLLDEADVFLASRSKAISGADLNRNALVAVFLRVLEYYTGILFLTTNRIGDFDEAFASRIHVSLKYPALDRDSTKAILKLNIRLITERFKKSNRKIEIDELEIGAAFLGYWERYEKARLNGRQIRNACQTAVALAEFEAQGGSHETIRDPNATVQLNASHFDTVLRAYLEFNQYLKAIHGTFQDEHAGEMGWRALEETPYPATVNQTQQTIPSGFPGRHLYPQVSQSSAPSWHDHQAQDDRQTNYRAQASYEQVHQTSPRYAPRNLDSLPTHRAASASHEVEPAWETTVGASAGHSAPHLTRPYNPGPPPQRHEEYQTERRY